MTRVYYDTEFLEHHVRTGWWPFGRRVHTIELISIGLVRADGAEYYAVNADAPWRAIRRDPWLRKNVAPSLPQIRGDQRHYLPARSLGIDFGHPSVKPKAQIADEVAAFVLDTPEPELWADYGGYDHVAVTGGLFGRMIDLPDGFPMFTCDLRQEAARLGNPDLPAQPTGLHNALADARHLKTRAEWLDRYTPGEPWVSRYIPKQER